MADPSIHERLVAGRERIANNKLVSPFEFQILSPLYDALELIYRPSTNEGVDESLTRLGDYDNVIQATAYAALRYVHLREEWGKRSIVNIDLAYTEYAERLRTAYEELAKEVGMLEEVIE
jgi:hypothetical protein